jgi:hypothetical protein
MKKSRFMYLIPFDCANSIYLDDKAIDKLKTAIANSGMSRPKISAKTNNAISTIYLHKILNKDRRSLSKEKLLILLEVLDIELEDLLSDVVKKYFD